MDITYASLIYQLDIKILKLANIFLVANDVVWLKF